MRVRFATFIATIGLVTALPATVRAQSSWQVLNADASAVAGDPVHLSTGLYVREHDDLNVPGDPPLVLTRTYRTQDNGSRPFGVGTSHSYHLYLIGDGETLQWAALILADGGRISFRRVSPGTGRDDAVFEHASTPSTFFGSKLYWNGTGWTIELRDRSRYTFRECGPRGRDLCHLLTMRDADGANTVLSYDTNDHLTEIRRSDAAWIKLSYDRHHRITAAWDSTGREVRYTYDRRGHLVRVTHPGNHIQTYWYGRKNELRTLQEPGLSIVNSYDEAGRTTKQVVALTNEGGQAEIRVYRFSYRVEPSGKILETHVVNPSGQESYQFDMHGYPVSHTVHPGEADFHSIVYARDEQTNLVRSVTVRCVVNGEPVEASSKVTVNEPTELVRASLLTQHCRH